MSRTGSHAPQLRLFAPVCGEPNNGHPGREELFKDISPSFSLMSRPEAREHVAFALASLHHYFHCKLMVP